VTAPVVAGFQLYDQLARPVAGCHVVPPSTETSMAPTAPPTSAAVPVMTVALCGRLAPAAGAVIVDVGAVVSVVAVATDSGACRFAGCTFMSANRLTVACCMRWSVGVPARSWFASRPQVHCTV